MVSIWLLVNGKEKQAPKQLSKGIKILYMIAPALANCARK